MNQQDISDAKECTHCYSSIHSKAKICKECSGSQSIFDARVDALSKLIPTIALIPAFLVVGLSYYQLMEAKKETDDAKNALILATTVNNDVKELQSRVRRQESLINDFGP